MFFQLFSLISANEINKGTNAMRSSLPIISMDLHIPNEGVVRNVNISNLLTNKPTDCEFKVLE